MDEKDDNGDRPNPQIIIAVEDTRLGVSLEASLRGYNQEFVRVAPGQLLHREYPDEYTIFLETGHDLARMKEIAKSICRKWAKPKKYPVGAGNFEIIYIVNPEDLGDRDVIELWAIAGWDFTFIRGKEDIIQLVDGMFTIYEAL
jgi:hypothetical protein